VALKDILNKIIPKSEKKEETPEDFMEFNEDAFKENRKVSVRIETLKDYTDADRVQQLVREGNVVFLKIKELRGRNINELKRAVDRLKKTCAAMNGDIVGVDEDFLIVTPNFARVFRGKAA
jgi:SepF-like predicted cell division protein (DUF552 family)